MNVCMYCHKGIAQHTDKNQQGHVVRLCDECHKGWAQRRGKVVHQTEVCMQNGHSFAVCKGCAWRSAQFVDQRQAIIQAERHRVDESRGDTSDLIEDLQIENRFLNDRLRRSEIRVRELEQIVREQWNEIRAKYRRPA